MFPGINFSLWSTSVMIIAYVVFVAFNTLEAKGDDVLVSMSQEIKARIEPPEDESKFKLPVITSTPIRLALLINDTAVFPCKVENLGSHVVIWKRDNTHILFSGSVQAAQDPSLSLLEHNSLRIRSVEPKHAGKYTCQVSSGQAILSHVLEVQFPPKVVSEPKDGNVVVKKEDSTILKCHAEGYPPPVITWTAAKGNLPGGVSTKQGKELDIPSADTEHSGEYYCTAENGIGDPVTAHFRVKVLYSPEVKVKPEWTHAGIGSTVEFSCIVSAEPDATIRWTHFNGTSLVSDSHISIHTNGGSSSKVKIKGIKDQHLGSYNCSAENRLGSNYRAVEVSGLAEPVTFKSNTSGEQDTSFFLLWTAKSYSQIYEYMLRVRRKKEEDDEEPAGPWTQVIIPVDNHQSAFSSHSYNITGLEPAMAYEVVMQVRNIYGWNYPSEAFTFYTYGRGQIFDQMEGQSSESTTTRLHPTTNRLEKEDNKSLMDPNTSTDTAASFATLGYILSFIASLAVVVWSRNIP